jgi:hypothetical protein
MSLVCPAPVNAGAYKVAPFWMGKTALPALKTAALYRNPRTTTRSDFVAAVPSRVFRDGTGRFMVNLSRGDEDPLLARRFCLRYPRSFKISTCTGEGKDR